MHKNNKVYETGDPAIDSQIDTLVAMLKHPETANLVHEIITSAVKFGQESDNVADLRLANAALKEIRHSCKVFSPYRTKRKVIVFGSARSKPDSAEYKMAEKFAHTISENGFMVITGGGPGVMEAGNKGALDGMDFALNIRLPFEQHHNQFVEENEKLINYKYFFTRKLFFVKETDATTIFPGGFGTLDEAFEMLTLVQTGKARPRPIVFMEPLGMSFWQDCRQFLDNQLQKNGFIGNTDSCLYTIAHTVEEAVEYIKQFFRVYHSIRYDEGITIIRLNYQITPLLLQRLNQEFSDIITSGEIAFADPTEREMQDNDVVGLPRLGFNFNRKEFGRLHAMIRMINEG